MDTTFIIKIPVQVVDPIYRYGMAVSATNVEASKWPNLDAGVYGIEVGNFFIIKRVKKKKDKEIKTIKFQNPFTGGASSTSLSMVSRIFCFHRIIDAPVV